MESSVEGFISGLIASGGDLQQGLLGALSAGVFGVIGASFGPTSGLSIAGRAAKVLAHGVAGGGMSVLRGGKFKDGFVSAGFSQVMEVTNAYSRMGVRAGASGFAARTKNVVVSALVGGKFANGAITAAFSRMFNDEAHASRESKIRALEVETLEMEIRSQQKKIYSSKAQYHRSGNYVTTVNSEGDISYVDLMNPPNGMLANSTPFLNVAAVGYIASSTLVRGAVATGYLEFNQGVYAISSRFGADMTGDAFVMDYMVSMLPATGAPSLSMPGMLGYGAGFMYGFAGMEWK
ncbi:hypothetical protein DKW60_15580 [Leucothrix pacifica]|uniref:Uncharacterized protein n=2 Tax=Leucothrix pacifica TaxID=1247513 RepID=A0A317C963_9GAMM|nr:hypothetical protein DKW60_15580 [Leucothrix pacifica]